MRYSTIVLSLVASLALAEDKTLPIYLFRTDQTSVDAEVVEADATSTHLAFALSDGNNAQIPVDYYIISTTTYQAAWTVAGLPSSYACVYTPNNSAMSCAISASIPNGVSQGNHAFNNPVFATATATKGAELLSETAVAKSTVSTRPRIESSKQVVSFSSEQAVSFSSEQTASLSSGQAASTSSGQAASTSSGQATSSPSRQASSDPSGQTTSYPTGNAASTAASATGEAAPTSSATGAAYRFGVQGPALLALAGAAAINAF
ncbi:hypothetical protein K504DRAFT_462384 [Pleomassaria siparia CBS 279.74]|uniref:Uncharacterized protein n=1 Tax=Pleomassaria siparia CBS 279.74 TaxID=1314801 RepID=A0A6G1KLY9_9PLEO|nr:hypothetical protein K504DRAFT_462384 [Pleomassaria siparia CBS 279.74]